MTRDEEVRNAIDAMIPIQPSRNGRTYEQALMASGFEAGVQWADTHPKSPWISVNSSKPKDHKELHRLFKGMLIRDDMCTVPVIARAVNGDKVIYIMAYMFLNKFTNLWEWVSLNKPIGKIYSITHWMPIPKLE